MLGQILTKTGAMRASALQSWFLTAVVVLKQSDVQTDGHSRENKINGS